MAIRTELTDLAQEMLSLEAETFEINDYAEAQTALLGATSSTSCDSSSCSSSTTSTTSCSCA